MNQVDLNMTAIRLAKELGCEPASLNLISVVLNTVARGARDTREALPEADALLKAARELSLRLSFGEVANLVELAIAYQDVASNDDDLVAACELELRRRYEKAAERLVEGSKPVRYVQGFYEELWHRSADESGMQVLCGLSIPRPPNVMRGDETPPLGQICVECGKERALQQKEERS